MNNNERLEFDNIATNIFGPIYPVIAKQIKEKTGVHSGICIDLGCGGGHLGIAMAEISDMYIYLLDNSAEALDIAAKRIKSNNIEKRIEVLRGDAEDIPLKDGYVNLAISRGSVWFWEDQVKAFKEIYRILTPGGFAYIGGGFGTKELREEIDKKMIERNSDWKNKKKEMRGDNTTDKFKRILNQADINNYEIIDDESGFWIVIKK